MKRINLQNLFILILLIINISFIVLFYNQKTSFHVDELFSFGHANSSQGAFLVDKVDCNFNSKDISDFLLNRWIDSSKIHEYITVQHDEKFKYSHIYENLSADVHPPLFYLLLHTICSFFPDTFSKWYGAMLNIPIWIALLIMMYKLSSLFFKDKYLSLLPVVFYAYSQIGINTVIFIRMYLLQTLWSVCLLYEAVLMIKDKKVNKSCWFLIFLYSYLGMITQYNSIIFSAVIGIILGINLILQKRYKDLIIFALVLLLSLAFFLISFPQFFHVIQYSSRSNQLISAGQDFFNTFLYRVLFDNKKFIDIYMNNLWSFNKPYSQCLALIMILTLFYKYYYTKESKDIDYLLIIYVIMCLYIAAFMPNMYIYNMRYIMPIIPIISIVTIYYLVFILSFMPLKVVKIICSVIILFNSVFVDFNNRSPFVFQLNDTIATELKNKKVIIRNDLIWKLFTNLHILENADSVYFIQIDEGKDLDDKDVFKQLENSDYFINNDREFIITYNKEYLPTKRQPLEEKVEQKIVFLKTIKIGEFFYDIYKIKK